MNTHVPFGKVLIELQSSMCHFCPSHLPPSGESGSCHNRSKVQRLKPPNVPFHPSIGLELTVISVSFILFSCAKANAGLKLTKKLAGLYVTELRWKKAEADVDRGSEIYTLQKT